VDFSHLSAQLSGRPIVAIAVLFAGGVLTSLTPCIYPMIPITAAIVGGSQAGVDPSVKRMRPILLALVYALGLSVVYALLGLFAGMTGTIFGTVSSNPWAYFAMANLLLIAALSMLDVFPIRVPSWVLNRASAAGTGGTYSGALVMGGMSGFVAAPCSAPVMAAVLTWVTTTKSAVLGFVYLFAFSLGMCTLLVAIGASSGFLARMPRAGAWMVWIKLFFALAMFGVGAYYLVKMGLWII
jgi:thiol:disulfide interchange protein DsbD